MQRWTRARQGDKARF